MPALDDRERSGRPPTFTAPQIAEVKALACRLPTESEAPFSRWSCPELAREAVFRAIIDTISAPTVRRWLKADALKPWQHQSWIFIRDPNFRATANESWTCTPASSTAPRSAKTSTSSLRTRKPPSKPAVAAIPPWPPAAAEPWPTWPPRTSTGPKSSAAVNRPQASCRS
ncbi:helix-turn-helix domain-containing protein [Streptomyces johnsoniae]|uniref:Helix-turn-helix domain-containing protein n=1 Tax=Streptomyces johnsoniae TaxID=3075532 RepID=A0ABU2S0S9_9ACTN|nr:helix-turn-helix domain-containing protein [Streptomyces sp. DSM 41886]MDT0441359.1 helix-turn-helix domain-containing protein [Streptomyces sp. DSM 41886]